MRSTRVIWVDNLRAIGIFLVVWAHHDLEISGYLLKYIYSFHMPLFFIVSGYLFTPQKYGCLREFIGRKIRTLIVPYMLFSTVAYSLWAAKAVLFRDTANISVYEVLKPMLAVLISSNDLLPMYPNAPMWFLPCLFLVELEFFLIHRTLEKGRSALSSWFLILSICGALGYLLYRMRIPLPWGISTSFTVLFLYSAGYFLKDMIDHWNYSVNSTHKVMLAILLIAIAGGGDFMNGFVNLSSNRMSNPILFYITGLSATMGYIFASQLIPTNRLMLTIGSNTLVVLAFHIPAGTAVGALLLMALNGHQLGVDANPIAWSFLFSLLQVCSLLPLIYVMNRWFPSVMGRRVKAE
jgi:acyltransferase